MTNSSIIRSGIEKRMVKTDSPALSETIRVIRVIRGQRFALTTGRLVAAMLRRVFRVFRG